VNRPLRVGDLVCIREEAVEHLRRTECAETEAHSAGRITETPTVRARRVLHVQFPWQRNPMYAWPSALPARRCAVDSVDHAGR
jgi:hypothetical protein